MGKTGIGPGRPEQKITKKKTTWEFYPKHQSLIKAQAKREGISQPKLMLKAFLQYWSRENKR